LRTCSPTIATRLCWRATDSRVAANPKTTELPTSTKFAPGNLPSAGNSPRTRQLSTKPGAQFKQTPRIR